MAREKYVFCGLGHGHGRTDSYPVTRRIRSRLPRQNVAVGRNRCPAVVQRYIAGRYAYGQTDITGRLRSDPEAINLFLMKRRIGDVLVVSGPLRSSWSPDFVFVGRNDDGHIAAIGTERSPTDAFIDDYVGVVRRGGQNLRVMVTELHPSKDAKYEFYVDRLDRYASFLLHLGGGCVPEFVARFTALEGRAVVRTDARWLSLRGFVERHLATRGEIPLSLALTLTARFARAMAEIPVGLINKVQAFPPDLWFLTPRGEVVLDIIERPEQTVLSVSDSWRFQRQEIGQSNARVDARRKDRRTPECLLARLSPLLPHRRSRTILRFLGRTWSPPSETTGPPLSRSTVKYPARFERGFVDALPMTRAIDSRMPPRLTERSPRFEAKPKTHGTRPSPRSYGTSIRTRTASASTSTEASLRSMLTPSWPRSIQANTDQPHLL